MALYWTTWSQIKSFIAKTSHKDKRKKTAQLKLTDTTAVNRQNLLILDFVIISFVKEE
jgi:hypothetical protein